MPHLLVPNALLHYEVFPPTADPSTTADPTHTSQPLILFTHGGNGRGDIFTFAATLLAPSYRVAIYDRRGFTHSPLTGPQDWSSGSARLATDTDDARALIEHLNSHATSKGAIVLGNSSGALVALELVIRHPDIIQLLIAHEPPALQLLPEPEAKIWMERQRTFYDLYRAQGPMAAMQMFGQYVRIEHDPSMMATGADPAANPFFMGNLLYWFEGEVLAFTLHAFDVQRLKEESERGKLVLVNGKGTHPEAIQGICNVALADRVGGEVLTFEGGHVAFKADPGRFVEDLKGLLSARGL